MKSTENTVQKPKATSEWVIEHLLVMQEDLREYGLTKKRVNRTDLFAMSKVLEVMIWSLRGIENDD